MDERPGRLAIRTVNQYRRRDVLTYLSLRYYLGNSASRSDSWAENAATKLVISRSEPSYFRSFHFKDINKDGGVEHRILSLPCANEAIAEAHLLDECSKRPMPFRNPSCVYSYSLREDRKPDGSYLGYVDGLNERQQGIARACKENPNGIVYYTDIKKFYPSIGSDLAARTWKRYAELGGLSKLHIELGEKLIGDHSTASGADGQGILTGPMFSHLVANLILRDVDRYCSNILPAQYFRYVDDITLVGDKVAVARSLEIVKKSLSEIGFTLHDSASTKTLEVRTSEWLVGQNDFARNNGNMSWMIWVANLKRFLVSNPLQREILRSALLSHGMRVPVRDYTNAIHERSYLQRLKELAEHGWFRRKAQDVSLESLIEHAGILRNRYESEIKKLLSNFDQVHGYERKRRIPKIRYRASRLVYLSSPESLTNLAEDLAGVPELAFHSGILYAVSTGDIGKILHYGSNAAQAVAQPLRAGGQQAEFNVRELNQVTEQGLAIFLMNGVSLVLPDRELRRESDLLKLATRGVDLQLMQSKNRFVRELSCLHGLSERPRHADILETAFDEDESLIMDAADQLHQSFSE